MRACWLREQSPRQEVQGLTLTLHLTSTVPLLPVSWVKAGTAKAAAAGQMGLPRGTAAKSLYCLSARGPAGDVVLRHCVPQE